MNTIRHTLAALALAAATSVQADEVVQLTQSDINGLYKEVGRSWVSVHDPSVVHTTGKNFYIIGTHRGWAHSTDNMISWSGLNNGSLFGVVNASGNVVVANFANAFSTNQTKTVRARVNGTVQEVPFGNFDAKAWGNGNQAGWDIAGNMWAPDLIWNPTMEKWCMYMSINGDSWHSVIVLLTADKITGPYVYQGPVTFSGFINTTTPEISWKKTDLELVIGTQTTLPARYDKGGDWGSYWPNDIDPCVFFDDDGQLWMSYGSWSGGIFLLKLDKETGLRDYTVTYPVTLDGGGRAITDPYFGRRIAGGYFSSGEGSYIQKIGNYYYLFISYGGLESTGGYEVAIFRSEQPEGPYLDAQGLDAFYNGRYWLNYGPNQQTTGGTRPFGAYAGWGFMTVGELAQGHNSAIVDEQGRAFIVYHTRFNDGGEGHQVRVHQLFQNKDGWLCAAPFQFDGEEDTDATLAEGCQFTKEEIAGDYDILIHRYKLDHANREVVTPQHISLNANGRITGDLTGTWAITNGTAYIRITAGNVTYNGVVVEQQVDGSTLKAICFTAMATSGVSLWGYHVEPKYAVAYTSSKYNVPVRAGQLINKNIDLSGTGYFGATIEWESSVPEVITHTGKYCPADTATRVTLTCRIKAANYVYERSFNVTAQKESLPSGDYRTGLVAYYDFDQKPTANAYDDEQHASYGKLGNGTAPALEEDLRRNGQVVHLYEGEQKNCSYVRFPNPLQGRTDLEGFTVAAWVLRADDNLLDALWSFTDRMATLLASVKQRLFLTGNAYLGFNDGTNYFDLNRPNDEGTNPTSYIPTGTWSQVVVTVSKNDGISLFVDGSRKTHKSFASSAGTASTASAAARLFDYQTVLDFITSAGYMQLGLGSFWGTPEVWFDDLFVYDRALMPVDVSALNTMSNRLTDFGPVVGIKDVEMAAARWNATTGAIYDLSGRRINQPTNWKPGIYVIDGKKVQVR